MGAASAKTVRAWRARNPLKMKEYNDRHNQNRKVRKRCPECRKRIVVRKDKVYGDPRTTCPHCGAKLIIRKTLSDNPHRKNCHGIMIKSA